MKGRLITGRSSDSDMPVVFATSIEIPVTPPSMKLLDRRKPFSPIAAERTPSAISPVFSDSWASRLRNTVLRRHSLYGVHVAKGRLALDQLFHRAIRDRRLGKPLAREPVHLAALGDQCIDP